MEQTKLVPSLCPACRNSVEAHLPEVEWKVKNFLKTDVKVNKTIAAAKKVKDACSAAFSCCPGTPYIPQNAI